MNTSADNTVLLIVDDDENILHLSQQILESMGYSVIGFSSPLEALEAVKANPNFYDLVITDMMMPELRGDKLITQIKLIKQDLPVILMTGYSDVMEGMEPEHIGACAFHLKAEGLIALEGAICRCLNNTTH